MRKVCDINLLPGHDSNQRSANPTVGSSPGRVYLAQANGPGVLGWSSVVVII